MKRLIFFSQEAGSANCVLPVYKSFEKDINYDVELFGKDQALEVYKHDDVKHSNIGKTIIGINENSVREFLKKKNFDLIVTGCAGVDSTERILWKVGEDVGIKSISILDNWVNYKTRFFNFSKRRYIFPDTICVMDSYAKREMVKEGIPSGRIKITGQPYLEATPKRQKSIATSDLEDLRKKFKIRKNHRVAIFASQPLEETHGDDFGYTQFTILGEVISAFETIAGNASSDKWMLIIKLHPQDDPNNFHKILRKYKEKSQKTRELRMEICKDDSPNILISVADVVIGMSSMFLIETAIVNKPYLSVQIGLSGKDSFILTRQGIAKAIYSRDDLCMALQKVSKEESLHYKKFAIKKNATREIVKVIKSFL